MGVGSHHHPARERIVFEDHLVDDPSSWLPEADTIFLGHCCQKIVNLLVGDFCTFQICNGSIFGQNQVIAMDRGGYCGLLLTGLHELKQSHLSSCILHGNTIRIEIHVGSTPFIGKHRKWFRKVCVQNFLCQGNGSAQ